MQVAGTPIPAERKLLRLGAWLGAKTFAGLFLKCIVWCGEAGGASAGMSISFSKQMNVTIKSRGRDGMTLIEVVVALAITGLTVGGIVTGYIFCTNSTVKDSLYMSANAKAMERIEQTRSAQWDTSSSPVVDQLVATNFPDKVVTLDLSGSGSGGTSATIRTAIVQISSTPPIRRITVDCIWNFRGVEWITNTIETIRTPDQ